MERKRRLLSVVIPAFNEEANIERAYDAICAVFAPLPYEFEIIFIDNHSTDGSFQIIRALAGRDPRVRGARLARNFGFHRAVLTGFRLAAGDAAVEIDCDLQDPPEFLPRLIELWERGHDVVVGVRRERNHAQAYQFLRRLFYRLLQRASNDGILADSGDFRLIDRTIIAQLHEIDDAAPFLRGLTSLLAKNQIGIPYDRGPRLAGESKFPIRKLFGFALYGLLAHSTVPLRIASFTGLAVALVTFLLSIFYVAARLVLHIEMPTGFATTTVLILSGISLNAIFLGIIGEYIGRIYDQIRVRPTAVISSVVNLSADAALVQSAGGGSRAFGEFRTVGNLRKFDT